jgi:hypothetical protein
MTNITLDSIKTEHSRIADMIATLEAKAKVEAAFPITVTFPELKAGERYIGAIISADGAKREHIILLPGELESANWKDATAWAKSIGGELPDRCEGALLFATIKDEFKPEWHWLREEHASYPDYAWFQGFGNGSQYDIRKSIEGRARAVRRLKF